MTPAILLTGVGKRYDIVACFAQLTTDDRGRPEPAGAGAVRGAGARAAAADRRPRLRAGAAGAVRAPRRRRGDPAHRSRHRGARAARAREGLLPALVPSPEVARATYDKYETHLLLARLGLPSPPTVLPEEEPDSYPVMVKPRRGSGARSIHLARDRGGEGLLRALRRRGARWAGSHSRGRAGDGAARDGRTRSSRSTVSGTSTVAA